MEYERSASISRERLYLRARERLMRLIRPNILRQREVNAALELFLQRIESKFNQELGLHEVRSGVSMNFMTSYDILKTIITEYATKQFELFLKELNRIGRRLTIPQQCYVAKGLTMLLHQKFVNSIFQKNEKISLSIF